MPRRFRQLLAIAALAAASLPSQAAIYVYGATLGPEVSGATGSGAVRVTYDSLLRTLDIVSNWSGLSGTTTVAHIHCCTPTAFTGTVGVAVTPGTLPAFPVGVTEGNYDTTPALDLSSASTYTGGPTGFLTRSGGTVHAAEAALFAGMNAGTAYFNVHSTAFPAGEIRGFLEPIPEPGTLALLGVGLGGLMWFARRRTV